MKKAALALLLAGLVFGAGLIGFYLGRRQSPDPVILSRPPAQIIQTEPSASISTGPVNINTASAEELETLPHIGPVIAQRIVEYRQQHGPFQTISELTLVSGIGINTLEELLELITVGG